MSRRQPSLISQVLTTVPFNSRLLVGVSGGKDSVTLLHVLARSSRRLKLHIEVGHVNHNLRVQSLSDSTFVEQLSAQYSIPCHVETLAPPASEINIEAWGRGRRYDFFSKTVAARGLDWTVTAHTANDLAENVLIRLLANKESGHIALRDERRRLIRPFLRATRAQIDEYASDLGLQWHEDETNSDESFTRNLVRHRILPVLSEQFGGSVVRTLAERGMFLGEDDLYLEAEGRRISSSIGEVQWGSFGWLRAASDGLSAVADPVRWRAVESMLLPHVGYPLGARRSALVAQIILKRRGRVDLGGNKTVSASSAGLVLS